MSRVVVIGAGVAGLATAARLGAAGHPVELIERSHVVGGKLGRYVRETPEGMFRFDTGPSLLTLPQVFADLFAATEPEPVTAPSAGSRELDAIPLDLVPLDLVPLDLVPLDLVPLDPLIRHVFADGSTLDTTSNRAELDRRIAAAFGERAAAEWRRLWRRAGRAWSASWRNVLRSPVESPLSLARLAWRAGDLAAIGPGRTLRGLGRAYLSDPRLRMLLDRYATYAGSDPRRAPAALLAIPFAEMTFGGWYPLGGLATLADALLARCEQLGVRVRTSTEVARVETAGGRVTGVRLAGGGHVAADVVVAATDALAVYRDLMPDPRRAARLARRSLSGFVLLLGVRRRTPGLAHHTVFFPADYDAEFDAVFGRGTRAARPAAEPTIFVTVADDPAVHPPGHEAWFLLVNAAPQGPGPGRVDWRTPGLADAYADHLLATLAARGVDLRDRIVFREIRTPADLEEATSTPGGAIYGTPRHGVSGLLRPRNRGGVRGLYLVGGSTHPGGGLPMVALSAEIVAAQIGSPTR